MAAHSTVKRRRRKTSDRPKKPYNEFPLYPHPLGYWSRKVDGKLLHFGRWGRIIKGKLERLPYEKGYKDALRLHNARINAAKLGDIAECVVLPEKQQLTKDTRKVSLAYVANRFLTAKNNRLEAKEISPRTFSEYKQATDLLVEKFGSSRDVRKLKPEDFESLRADMAKRWGPARLGKFIVMVRMVFGYAVDNRIIRRPIYFGTEFVKPDKAAMRKAKAARGRKLFTAAEIRTILDALAGEEVKVHRGKSGKQKSVRLRRNPQLRAAVLLGCNAALGNNDISSLQFIHLESQQGWLDFPRPKNGLPRRAPLWAETLKAIEEGVRSRPKPKSNDAASCVFLNRAGQRMVQSTTQSHSDYVSSQFRSVLRSLGIKGRRGLNFYSLRHTAATIGLQTGDRDAVKLMMGHAQHDILDGYDELGPSDKRLQRVVDHIHGWLFSDAIAKGDK